MNQALGGRKRTRTVWVELICGRCWKHRRGNPYRSEFRRLARDVVLELRDDKLLVGNDGFDQVTDRNHAEHRIAVHDR